MTGDASSNNVFLTTENLAFSLPLIAVCAIYAYFTLIPLNIGVPVIFGVVGIFQIRGVLKQLREKKLNNLDEGAIQNIIGELEEDEGTADAGTNKNAAAATKAKNRVQARLALEKKLANKKAARTGKSSGDGDDDDDDIGDLTAIAKPSSKKKA